MLEVEKSASKLRLFCAIELPQEVRSLAARYMAELREAAPDVRASWDREEKLHLTLKFFGDVEEQRLPQLKNAIERAASSTSGFELSLQGTGAFPPRGLPRVLWLGVVDASASLSRLHQHLEDESALEGFPRERKSFNPHLTIARLRSHEGARRLAELHKSRELKSEAFRVAWIVLMRSELSPHGSRYTPLEKVELKQE